MDVEVRAMDEGDREAAQACYRRNGYTGSIGPADDALVGTAREGVVAVVRIAHEQGVQILRGMFIDEARRGAGLGTRMITALAARMAPEPCWVICGPHLIRFYGRVGFRLTADEEAPPFLQERVARYRDTYGPQCLLRRPGRPPCDG